MKTVRNLLAAFAALPVTDIEGLLQNRRPLVLAPHPDDESLGCGGMIARACAAGLAPVVAILTDGAASHPGSRSHPPAALARLRETEALRAVEILGLPAENLVFLREPDSKLAVHAGVIEKLLELLSARGCGMVIGPWHGDPHCDHEAAARIAAAVAIRGGVPLLSYPLWGWLRYGDTLLNESRTAGWRLDIVGIRDVKARAIAAHESQHGAVVRDAPAGFCLPAALLAVAARPYEIYLAG